MIRVESLLPLNHGQHPEAIPDQARAREVAQRNRANLMRWFQAIFGDTPGRILCEEHLRGMA